MKDHVRPILIGIGIHNATDETVCLESHLSKGTNPKHIFRITAP